MNLHHHVHWPILFAARSESQRSGLISDRRHRRKYKNILFNTTNRPIAWILPTTLCIDRFSSIFPIRCSSRWKHRQCHGVHVRFLENVANHSAGRPAWCTWHAWDGLFRRGQFNSIIWDAATVEVYSATIYPFLLLSTVLIVQIEKMSSNYLHINEHMYECCTQILTALKTMLDATKRPLEYTSEEIVVPLVIGAHLTDVFTDANMRKWSVDWLDVGCSAIGMLCINSSIRFRLKSALPETITLYNDNLTIKPMPSDLSIVPTGARNHMHDRSMFTMRWADLLDFPFISFCPVFLRVDFSVGLHHHQH